MNYGRIKSACYLINITMAAVANLSPLLFLTFKELYGVSYTALGLLVLINFVTQLGVDLIFSFFSNKIDSALAVKITPYIAVFGLCFYAFSPFVFKENTYIGLVIGTVIFSAASGLAEVLISPLVAAIPAENPEAEMAKLHSVYAWGVVGVILVSTLFLLAIGSDLWYILALIYAIIPLIGGILFFGQKLPDMQSKEKSGGAGAVSLLGRGQVWLCIIAIFLGGASECTMAQWSSGYLEAALGIPKIWGDTLGVMAFAAMLGLGRTLYSKYGKSPERVLLFGAIGASVCYIVSALCPIPFIGLIACAMTGLCTSMLWPGCLIVSSDRVPDGGVFIYAMMAAGGDLGGAIGPQLVGMITDAVSVSDIALSISQNLGISAEAIGMKAGMLIASLFPLMAIFIYSLLLRKKSDIDKVKLPKGE